jgi:hypothetical protein
MPRECARNRKTCSQQPRVSASVAAALLLWPLRPALATSWRVNSFPLDGINRGELPVYVWFCTRHT